MWCFSADSLFEMFYLKQLINNKPEYGYYWRLSGDNSAGHFHIFWDGPVISSDWMDVMTTIRSIITTKTNFAFNVIYLGNIPDGLKKKRGEKFIADITSWQRWQKNSHSVLKYSYSCEKILL